MKKTENEGLKTVDDLLGVYMDHLSNVVKEDESTKRMVFLVALSAYSGNPLNLFLKGPSSIGKTYNVTQTIQYFPREDVWMLGGLSPTALVHDYGVLVDSETNEEIDLIGEAPQKEDYKDDKGKFNKKAFREAGKRWRERLAKAYYRVTLNRKILVFLEAPHPDTYMRLRPILSHDAWRISYKFTDKLSSGMLSTRHVVLEGWPACIFCTTETKYVEDLATRGFTITPDMTQKKYRAAVCLKGEMKAHPWKFKNNKDEQLNKLKEHMLLISAETVNVANFDVAIPYARELSKIFAADQARDMRDYDHFQTLIEMSCLLHFFQRPYLKIDQDHYWLANIQDYLIALNLFGCFEETTRVGLPGHIIEFFHKFIAPLEEPASYDELVANYNDVMAKKLSKKTLYPYVSDLRDVGWVDIIDDPADKRRRLVYSLKKPENSLHYLLRRSTPFFSEKDFEKWLEDTKNYSSGKVGLSNENFIRLEQPINDSKAYLYNKWGSEGTKYDISQNPTDDLTKAYIKTLFKNEYFLEPLEPESTVKTENKPESLLTKEYRRILPSDDPRLPSCWICHKPIESLKDLSNVRGKPAHKSCILKLKEGQKNE